MQIQSRIFVVGCVRSGTTLLQAMLAAHPDVYSYPERGFMIEAVKGSRPRMTDPTRMPLRRRLKRVVRLNSLPLQLCHSGGLRLMREFLNECGRLDLLPMVPSQPCRVSTGMRQLRTILDNVALGFGKSAWVDKHPYNIGYIDVIERYFAPAKVIHLLRPGPDVVASVVDAAEKYEMWAGPTSKSRTERISDAAALWQQSRRLTMQCVGQPNHLLVRYEMLVSDAKAVLSDICDFAGLSFTCAMLKPQVATVAYPTEVWKQGPGDGVRAPENKLAKLFDSSERELISRLCEIA